MTADARTTSGNRFGASPVDRAWAWSFFFLIAGLLALIYAFRDPAMAMVRVWLSSPSFEHGSLVIVVALLVLVVRLRGAAHLAPRPCFWGLLASVAITLIAAVGIAASVLLVQQLALIALMQALALTVLGPRVFKRLLLPLGYLYFAVPVGDVVVPALQNLTAQWTVVLLNAFQFTAVLDGYLIRLPNADFRVAEACAGLRFFLVGFASSILMAAFLLRSWTRRIGFLVVAIIVPLAGNTLRAASMVVFAERGILAPDSTLAHLTYGLGFTSILLALLFLIAFLMRDRAAGSSEEQHHQSAQISGNGRPMAIAGAALAAVMVPMAAHAYLDSDPGKAGTKLALVTPIAAKHWQSRSTDADGWRPSVPHADVALQRRYGADGASVDLFIAGFHQQRQGAEVVSDLNVPTGAGNWRETNQGSVNTQLNGGDIRLTASVIRSDGRKRLVWRIYWVDGRFTGQPIAAKLLQSKSRILSGDPRAAIIFASLEFDGAHADARAQLHRFLSEIDLTSAFSQPPRPQR